MNTEEAPEKTLAISDIGLDAAEEERLCPRCGTPNPLDLLQRRDYRCVNCKLELAYLDYAANGAIRGIFGWLLAPGDVVLGRYQIQSVLGKGGFGAAYLVDDVQLGGRRRALKEVPEALFDEYEASLLIKLDHPAIPDIIERKTANGMCYMVLKFGGSRTLGSERKRSSDGRIPQARLLPWMRQLCEVLAYLHGQTPPVIHRDLKPDNILLNDDDRIMLIDFGIAKEFLPDTMTRTLGRAMTHGFSPLEQVTGSKTDERSDIYSLGATFYALLTGRIPPGADERVSGRELILPSEIVPDVLPQVEQAIIKALSLNVNERQQTVREFARALESYDASPPTRSADELPTAVVGHGTAPIPTGHLPTVKTAVVPPDSLPQTAGGIGTPPTPRRIPVLAGVASGVAAIVATVFYLFSRQPAPPPVTANPPASQTPSVAPAQTPPAQPATAPPLAPTAQTPPAQPAMAQPPLAPAIQAPVVAPKPAEEQLIDLIPRLRDFPISLSQPFYRKGDLIQFTVDAPMAGYLHVFILEPGGRATLIYPNKTAQNNRVKPGPVRLPNSALPLKASPPYGRSWFIAVMAPHADNLYQQYTHDPKRKGQLVVELTAWQILDFLQTQMNGKEAKVGAAEMRVCAPDDPCD